MPVRQAANVMRGWNIGCLPVVEDGALVGIVTVSDLLRIVAEGADKPKAPVKRAAKAKTARRKKTARTRVKRARRK